MTSTQDLSAWDKDGRVFLFTSLTAGSSHIITATSRLETILKANKVPFVAIDTATNELARRLWGRRSGGKRLPGLVKEGYVIADLEEVEEWNEFGEINENIGDVPPASSAPPPGGEAVTTRAIMHPTTQPPAQLPIKPTPNEKTEPLQVSMKEAATQAASIAAARKGPTPGINDTKVAPLKSSLAEADAATKPETMNLVVESNDEVPVTPAPAGAIQQKHRGSSVSSTNPEEIKELEQSNAIPEADNEDEEQPKTQDQEAAVADKAPVSVED